MTAILALALFAAAVPVMLLSMGAFASGPYYVGWDD